MIWTWNQSAHVAGHWWIVIVYLIKIKLQRATVCILQMDTFLLGGTDINYVLGCQRNVTIAVGLLYSQRIQMIRV